MLTTTPIGHNDRAAEVRASRRSEDPLAGPIMVGAACLGFRV